MPIFYNFGHIFQAPENGIPDGSIALASKIEKDDLQGKITGKYSIDKPHLSNLLFDPQLYCLDLNPSTNTNMCWKLSTYPWFGIQLPKDAKYHKDILKGPQPNVPHDVEKDRKEAKKTRFQYKKNFLENKWEENLPKSPRKIEFAVEESIQFQNSLNTSAIIIPSPLTTVKSTDYVKEDLWLRIGKEICKDKGITKQKFATIAISDVCLSPFTDKTKRFLDMILDLISSKDYNGIYVVLEQSKESNSTRYISKKDTLLGLLYLVYNASKIPDFKIIVNFIGPYGLALRAVGADIWATNWYKGLVRFRLGDEKISPISNTPSQKYWSTPLAMDIDVQTFKKDPNKKNDFNKLVMAGFLDEISDITQESIPLIEFSKMYPEKTHVNWQTSINPSINHYLLSLKNQEKIISDPSINKIEYVYNWLLNAKNLVENISIKLGKDFSSQKEHVANWCDAFSEFRQDQKV